MGRLWGIGTDVVVVSRVWGVFERRGARFLEKMLHPIEMEQFIARGSRPEFLAGRWAYKEAVCKAVGSFRVQFPEMYLDYSASRPALRFEGLTDDFLTRHGIDHSHVSLSHDGGVCVAMVVLECLH